MLVHVGKHANKWHKNPSVTTEQKENSVFSMRKIFLQYIFLDMSKLKKQRQLNDY